MSALRISARLVALGIRLGQARRELALRRRVSVRLDMVARASVMLVLHVQQDDIRQLAKQRNAQGSQQRSQVSKTW